MRAWAWTLGLLLWASGCTETRVGTETGNPPAVSLGKLDVESSGDGMVIVAGETDAISPGGGEVSVRNVTQDGEPVSADVEEDGSFYVTLSGNVDDEYEVVASNDDGDSAPKTFKKGAMGGPPTGDWQSLHECDSDDPMAPISISEATVEGDTLRLTVHHSGGCGTHRYGLCYGGAWAESSPIQVGFAVLHDDDGDTCEAWLTETIAFDLTPFQDAYRQAYRTDEGDVIMGFDDCMLEEGRTGCSVLYEWGGSMVRIRNVSEHDFDNLIVGDEEYGTLAAGATTDYRDFGRAYRYAFVSLEIDGATYRYQPIDFVGETPLGPGNFTYELSVPDLDGDFVNIETVIDE